ncbi:MAG: hypothetical protein H7Z13_05170 [Ferruginibacter sp.]|nr:hypothetical protein [Ferruginibacter sp.]
MKDIKPDNSKIRESITTGLKLTFKKLLKAKRQSDGVFVFSENGIIKKIKASDIQE